MTKAVPCSKPVIKKTEFVTRVSTAIPFCSSATVPLSFLASRRSGLGRSSHVYFSLIVKGLILSPEEQNKTMKPFASENKRQYFAIY